MKQGSLVLAMLWMFLLTLLLFWLPVAGPLLAGFVGGRTAGGAGRGLLAAVLPAAILCLALAIFGSALIGIPVIGAIAGAGLFVLIVVQSLPLMAGALIGGLTV